MDLRQLRYFIALNEHRSFVRAADAMGITQPAFSRSIQGLELELGCQLVDRGSKDLRPTPEGLLMLQHGRSLVHGARNLVHEVQQMTKLDAGELRFGCSSVPADSVIPEAMIRFVERYPQIHARFEVHSWDDLSRSLEREEIEFFIADIRQHKDDPNFQTRALQPRHSGFFCRPGHPLLAKESLSTNDLFDYPLVGGHMPASVRKLLANLSGKNDLRLQVESEHLPALIQIVRHSNVICMADLDSLRPLVERNEAVQLHLRNLPIKLDTLYAQCGIVTRSGCRLSPAASAMMQTLIEVDQAQGVAA